MVKIDIPLTPEQEALELVLRMAEDPFLDGKHYAKARAIKASMEPVDPLVEIACDLVRDGQALPASYPGESIQTIYMDRFHLALKGVRKGREMSAGRRIVDWSVSTWPVAPNNLAQGWHIACSTDTGFLYVKYEEDGQS